MKAAALAVMAGLLLGGCSKIAASQYRMAMEYRVRDYQSAREAARARGDLLGVCTYSGLVAAAYAEAKDAANAEAWLARRREDCALAREALGLRPNKPSSRPGRPASGS